MVNQSKQRRQAGRRRVLVSAVVSLLGLCVAEGAAQLFPAELPLSPPVVPHPRWHHWHVPNSSHPFCLPEEGIRHTIHFNAGGQRDRRPLAKERPPGTVRIALLGDSCVEALQVEESQTVARQLECKVQRPESRASDISGSGLSTLDSRLSDSGLCEVLNFGCSGFCTVLEEIVLREEVLAYDPRAVVCFHHVSDLTEDGLNAARARRDDQGRIVAIPGGAHPGSGLRSALRDVQLYQLARRAFSEPRQHQPKQPFAEFLHEPCGPEQEAAWNLSLTALERMADLCRTRGVRFLVVIIPVAAQVEPPDGRRLDSVSYQRRVAGHCAAHGIDCLDLLPGFRAACAPGSPRLFLQRDQHWTPAGHELAARLVAACLSRPPAIK